MTFSSKINWIKFFCFFNSFSTSKCFVLLELIFWLRLFSLSWKFVFLIKFACANLAVKNLAAKLLNSEVVIYLSWSSSVSFFFNFSNFCAIICFLTKLLTLSISSSAAVNAEFVAKPVILGILFSISVILALQSNFLTSRATTSIRSFLFHIWYLCHT